ncbi:MAG: hypothetical protein ABEI74_03985 [Candidatus Pacearchaeota archaeon]
MFFKNPNKKKGLSNVLMMVVALGLVVSLGAIIMKTTRDTVEEKTEQVDACGTDILGKLSVNSEWTCYDSNKEVLNVQLAREDIKLEKLTLSVSTNSEAYNFDLNETMSNPSEKGATLYPFNSSGKKEGKTKILEKRSEKNYLVFGLSQKPSSIEIAPTIAGNQCEVTDEINRIADCSSISGIDFSN